MRRRTVIPFYLAYVVLPAAIVAVTVLLARRRSGRRR